MIELKNDGLHVSFPEVHAQAKLCLQFMRTLRIPDDHTAYPVPPGLVVFHMCHVDDCAAKLPQQWLDLGGVMMPMYQAEALWLRFESGGYPFAIKVATGKINAVTGKKFSNVLDFEEQDYLVAPNQPWLDGFCVKKGTIRQFVAMPLDDGYTVEEQVTGKADFGGLQIIVYPMKAIAFEAREQKRQKELLARTETWGASTGSSCAPAPQCTPPLAQPAPESQAEPPRSAFYESPPQQQQRMGMGAGGRMHQEIVEDPFDPDDWDTDNFSRCFIHLVNSQTWRSVTGSLPPSQPPTAFDYNRCALPWFEYYDEKAQSVDGASVLRNVKSVYALAEEKEVDDELPFTESFVPKNIQSIEPKRSKDLVRDGKRESVGDGLPELCETTLYPVIYCGTAGGGPGEYLASDNPDFTCRGSVGDYSNYHDIRVIPEGKIIAVFYQPFHNIRAMGSFASIDTAPHPTAHDTIKLGIASWPGTSARLRIKITVLYMGYRLPAAQLAERRRARGLKLNYPDAIELITSAILEGASEGKSVAALTREGTNILTKDDVMDGVASMISVVQVEATFPDGTTKVICVHSPVR